MVRRLPLMMHPQPNDTTCGPTCLQAIYEYYKDPISLTNVIDEVDNLEEGGTLAVFLGTHALKRGYRATIYSYNISIFDPTWFGLGKDKLMEKLHAQGKAKSGRRRLKIACDAAHEFLQEGGEFKFDELTPGLLRKLLRKRSPLITGVSSTYLYGGKRELDDSTANDVSGYPVGHFIVAIGYNPSERSILVADPYLQDQSARYYPVSIQRFINSILLGIVTHDANILVIEKE